MNTYAKLKIDDPIKAMNAAQIYISSQGKQWGPYSLEQVNFLLTKGSFQLSDWAWVGHIAKWVSVDEVLGSLDQRDEQKESHPTIQQSNIKEREAKSYSSHVEKPATQMEVACVSWWRKSVFRNLLGATIGGLVLLLVLGWGSKEADYSTLERRDGIAFEPGSNKPFNGRASSYYPNGKPMYEAKFEGGMEEGQVVSWYMNGEKQSEANMRKGKFHGVVNYWYDNGQKMSHYTYENGEVIHRKDWDPDGGAYKRE